MKYSNYQVVKELDNKIYASIDITSRFLCFSREETVIIMASDDVEPNKSYWRTIRGPHINVDIIHALIDGV